MPSFTVHTPGGQHGAEKAVFVSDGWSWPAFIFGPLWLTWHRQWLALVGYIVLWVALTAAGRALGLHPVAGSLLSSLINIGLALEGGQIRRWTLARRGAPAVAVVSAPKESDAEIKYFVARQPVPTPAPAGTRAPASVASPNQAPAGIAPWSPPRIIGSFPEPGGR